MTTSRHFLSFPLASNAVTAAKCLAGPFSHATIHPNNWRSSIGNWPATRTTTSTAATLEPVQLVRTEALLQPVNWHHKGPVLWSVQNHPNHILNLINSSVKTCFLISSRPDWCTAETYKCDKHHIYHAFTWKTAFKRNSVYISLLEVHYSLSQLARRAPAYNLFL